MWEACRAGAAALSSSTIGRCDGGRKSCSLQFGPPLSLCASDMSAGKIRCRPRRRARPSWTAAHNRHAAIAVCGLLVKSQGALAMSAGNVGNLMGDIGGLTFVASPKSRIFSLSSQWNRQRDLRARPAFFARDRRHSPWSTGAGCSRGRGDSTRYGYQLCSFSVAELVQLSEAEDDDDDEEDMRSSALASSGRTSTTTANRKNIISRPSSRSFDVESPGSQTTTRLGFLRQSSTAALIITAAAASSGLVAPEHRVAASASAADITGTAAPTASATANRGAPGGDMVWLDEDTGTVVSRMTAAEETYCEGFVAYLARFLLNYDDACKRYFDRKVDGALKKGDGSENWEEFRGFVASVGYGLHRFQGAEGPRQLCESLARKYTSGNRDDGAPGQLATLFSLLPADRQPVSAIKSLLSASTRPTTKNVVGAAGAATASPSDVFSRVSASMSAVGFDLPSILEESPSSLLPRELLPQFDQTSRSFSVPGVKGKQGEMLLVFGTRGPFPDNKERSLTPADFGLFAACGAFGCTTTHLTVVPLDVVKTRLQTEPGRYAGLAEGVSTIAREEGWPMLLQGLGPTLLGYFWYGITVYPGYELFKRLYIALLGPLNAALFRVPLVLAAGATATCFACIGVCPAEAVRIRQVADPTVGDMPTALKLIVSESGWGKLYEGLPSILFRQISFGMMKFLVFDFFTEFAYGILPMLAEQTSTQLGVSLTSGLVAGVCAAIVSQPADTVLSTMNRDPGRASILATLRAIVEERGLKGLFLGLQSRIVWSGAIISGQFLLYDVCKTALHVGADDLKVFLDVIASVEL